MGEDMQIDISNILITILPALLAMIPGIYAITAQRKKNAAEEKDIQAAAAEKLVVAAGDLGDSYKALIIELTSSQDKQSILTKEIRVELEATRVQLNQEIKMRKELQKYNKTLESAITLLIQQVEALGGKSIVRKNGKYAIIEKDLTSDEK